MQKSYSHRLNHAILLRDFLIFPHFFHIFKFPTMPEVSHSFVYINGLIPLFNFFSIIDQATNTQSIISHPNLSSITYRSTVHAHLYFPKSCPFLTGTVILYGSGNRPLQCLAILPAGLALWDFRTIEEPLTALRDSIKAHSSLYFKGKILHRDISENNIIITDPKKANGFTGMLIDLDLTKEIGSEQIGETHPTGTMEFMSIEVLRKVPHSYRHDVESFYVLLWICARRVRQILFPHQLNGCMLVGTPSGPPENLYNPIIEA